MLDEDKWQWVDEDPFGISGRPESEGASASQRLIAALLASGQRQFAQLRFEEAAASYSAAIVIEPNHGTAHFNLAVCLEKSEKWEAALDSFRRAVEIDSSRVEARIGGGTCLLRLDNNAEALAWFENSLQQSTAEDPARGLFGKAISLHRLGHYEQANTVYQELLRIDPDAPEPLANLIALSIAREDMGAAYKYSRRLLGLNAQSKAALQGLAEVSIRKGDAAAAVAHCTRLVEADPDSFEGRFNLRFAQERALAQEQPERSIA
jgi:protein O-GlcNAc transferase